MPGLDSTVYRGFYDTPMIQDRMRLYSQQEKIFQLIALRQRNPLSLLTIISEKFGVVGADMITDWRFRYQEMGELPLRFTMAAASARPANDSLIDYVKLTNNDAASLHTNHRLLSKGTYAKATVTAHSDVNTTMDVSVGRVLNETLKVLTVGSPDSGLDAQPAASGYTWVKVKRAHPASSVTGQMVAIPDGTVLELVNTVAKTNQRPNPPISQNGSYQENVVQLSRESYGIGEHANQGKGIKTLLMEDGSAQLDMNYTLCETRLMKVIEKAIIMGRRSAVELGNESEYETGGILEFIPASNYINVNGVYTVSRVNDVVATALDTSGVRELWWFGGSTHTKMLASAYENKRGFGDSTEMSVRYGLKVSEITGTGRDGIVYYVNAPILSDLGMDDQSLILNLNEYNYGEGNPYGAFQIAEKVALQDLPEGSDSYESNSGFKGKWRELYLAWGLIRRLQDTHFRVYGVTQ